MQAVANRETTLRVSANLRDGLREVQRPGETMNATIERLVCERAPDELTNLDIATLRMSLEIKALARDVAWLREIVSGMLFNPPAWFDEFVGQLHPSTLTVHEQRAQLKASQGEPLSASDRQALETLEAKQTEDLRAGRIPTVDLTALFDGCSQRLAEEEERR